MAKTGPVEILWAIFGISFLATFAEFGIAAYTNTLESSEFIIAGQLVASIMLFMLMSTLAIFRDM